MNTRERIAMARGFLIGALAGALAAGITALLTAPYSGRTTRELLKSKGEAWKARTDRTVSENLDRVEEMLDEVRGTLTSWSETGREMADTAKDPAALAGRAVEKALK